MKQYEQDITRGGKCVWWEGLRGCAGVGVGGDWGGSWGCGEKKLLVWVSLLSYAGDLTLSPNPQSQNTLPSRRIIELEPPILFGSMCGKQSNEATRQQGNLMNFGAPVGVVDPLVLLGGLWSDP